MRWLSLFTLALSHCVRLACPSVMCAADSPTPATQIRRHDSPFRSVAFSLVQGVITLDFGGDGLPSPGPLGLLPRRLHCLNVPPCKALTHRAAVDGGPYSKLAASIGLSMYKQNYGINS